ncbi:MAG: hypothetical protein AMS18_07750 [Gemmatimonas sp. SG8_17]|nr:MAG: hypothetical protein AMS18_07750 [Gemmatimonas sp. SG8_17]
MIFWQDVDEHHIADSKLQIVGSALQIGDSKLQIGDSRLRIVDFNFPRAGLDRQLDVTTLQMVDSIVERPRRSSISTIRSFKLAIRSFKSAIRNVPQRHAAVESVCKNVVPSSQNPKSKTRSAPQSAAP